MIDVIMDIGITILYFLAGLPLAWLMIVIMIVMILNYDLFIEKIVNMFTEHHWYTDDSLLMKIGCAINFVLLVGIGVVAVMFDLRMLAICVVPAIATVMMWILSTVDLTHAP